ncbi:hypothetical protein HPB50_010783 [Hyalomma asiaticum]|uniref:Uncharacterized protein n=1 Tax=Hyalomma asiaticum TaxID=266040 RepID=A0ACB7T9A6_HYAAI|nr:hypothetical protein HPB50_010783 [Hyalomma asiaticum]
MRSPISVALLLGLFCLCVTSLPTSYSVGSPYSLVYPDYPLTYHHTAYAQPYQAAYQTGYQPGYQSTGYQSGYQAGYPSGYQNLVVVHGAPPGHHVQLVPATVPGARPVLVPLVPVVQQPPPPPPQPQQPPHRQPLRPERGDRPQVVHPKQVCFACLTTISAAVLLQPLASVAHCGSTPWTSDLEDVFVTLRMPALRFSHLVGDQASALELEPLTGEPSTDAGCSAETESDRD